jgi:hypothetical protein
MKKQVDQLCALLSEACDRLVALGNAPIFSTRYNSGPDIAAFIRARLDGVSNNSLSLAEKREMWTIFAPTCTWDDSVGDVDLGERVFELLDELYGNDIVKE